MESLLVGVLVTTNILALLVHIAAGDSLAYPSGLLLCASAAGVLVGVLSVLAFVIFPAAAPLLLAIALFSGLLNCFFFFTVALAGPAAEG